MPPIIKGEKIFTLAFLGNQGSFNDNESGIKATATGDGTCLLKETSLFVQYVHVADIVNNKQVKPTLFLVEPQADTLQIMDMKILGIDKKGSVQFNNTPVSKENILGKIGDGHTYINKILFKGIVFKCGEMIGG